MLLALLAIIAMAPATSFPLGLVMISLAAQMLAGRRTPWLPARLAERPLDTRYLRWLVGALVRPLRFFESAVRPRFGWWIANARVTVALAILALSCAVAFIPIPFSNIPPAAAIALLCVAYLERDGAVLAAGIVLAAAGFVATLLLLWELGRQLFG